MASVIELFLCYARKDEELRKGLEIHLRAFRRQGLINVWHDREIIAGTEWEREIDKHLNSAQIILLLVSPDFMDSEYCYGIEMKRAIERNERGEARVIPVILRPVHWKDAPFGKLQALPTDAEPVTSSRWHNLDDAFNDVVEGIYKTIQELMKRSPENKKPQEKPPIKTPSRPFFKSLSQKSKEQWLREGYLHINLKQYKEALIAVEQTILLDPNNAEAYNIKGYALGGLKRYEEALAALEQAIHIDPNLAAPYNNKGTTLYNLKRYEEALAALEQAIRLNPNFADAYNNKGHVLYRLRRYEEALAVLEQAIRLDPNFADAYANKGYALQGLGREKEAQQAFEKALQLDLADR